MTWGVRWFYCKYCGVNFSWIYDSLGGRDPGCPKCHSKDVVRVDNKVGFNKELNKI